MKETRKIAELANATAVDFGKLNEINEYVLELGPEMKIPGTETGFIHTHKTHEELYFFLSGKGEFQVDGEVFNVEEGSVVRVAPAGKRSVRNNGKEPLLMLCVQYLGNTFTNEDAADGIILNEKVEW